MKRTAIFLIFTTSIGTANAQGVCNPDSILRSNVEHYSGNLMIDIANDVSQSRSTQNSDSGSIGLSYAGIGLKGDDAHAFKDAILNQTSFKLSKQQSISLLRSTLSLTSVEAYLACLNAGQDLAIAVSDNASTSAEFFAKLHWKPTHPVPNTSKLKISLIGAHLIDGSDNKASEEREVQVSPQSLHEFHIKRDSVCKPVSISAAVEDQNASDEVALPGIPAVRFEVRDIFFPPQDQKEYELSLHDTSLHSKNHCISPPNDSSILIPGTLHWAGNWSGDAVSFDLHKDTNNALNVCLTTTLGTRCAEDRCNTKISGRAVVKAIVMVDAPEVCERR